MAIQFKSATGFDYVSSATPLPVTIVGGGTGDVDGPASATDNAIVRFDGTTGKLIQNSVVTIADTTGAFTWASGQDAVLNGGNGGVLTLAAATTFVGGAGNMVITAGTGNSRTLALQTTTAGGVATTALTLNADQSATFAGAISGGAISGTTLALNSATSLVATLGRSANFTSYVVNGASSSFFAADTSANTGWGVRASSLEGYVSGAKVIDVTSTGLNNTVIGATTPAAGSFTTGTFGGSGVGSYSALVVNNDQSNVRLRFENTGSGGQIWSIVGGTPGAANSGLAIYNESGSATVAQFSSTGLSVTGTLTSSGLFGCGGSTPASASATGTAGTITWDSSYIYVCTATNTWKRVAIATW